jgi:hypothetical protein
VQKTIVAATLGKCVHVAGVTNHLHLAENAGWRSVLVHAECMGVLETPRLKNNAFTRGRVFTRISDGSNRSLSEKEHLKEILHH